MATKSIKQHLKLNKKIAIIGAGASGVLCSIVLSRAKFDVTVFEKNSKIGRKILATGNGKCNISNENISQNNYYTTNPDLLNHALKQFGYKEFKAFFENLGMEIMSKENGRVYPFTQQSSTVSNILEYEAKFLGVKFILNTCIEDISYQNNKFRLNNNDLYFDKIIIASGSAAMPKLGSSDIGYKFAQNFGHSIIEPFASLVQLISDNHNIKQLHGLKIDAKATLEINKEHIMSVTADVLFTNYGLSGNAIIDISREAAYALTMNMQVDVVIDIFPNIKKDTLINILLKRVKNSHNKDKYFWLEGLINKKLIPFLIDNCAIKKDITFASQLNKKDIMSLVYFMKNIKINITGTKGFETSEVSAGGINTFEIDTKSMQSKLQKGLYFIGEVVDVDGQCGGYNLHWAWASGYVCAKNIQNET